MAALCGVWQSARGSNLHHKTEKTKAKKDTEAVRKSLISIASGSRNVFLPSKRVGRPKRTGSGLFPREKDLPTICAHWTMHTLL